MSKMIENETEETPIEETKMSKMILGKETEETPKAKATANYLSEKSLWFADKKGCGKSLLNGPMIAALMNESDKAKARAGIKKIESKTGFVFERKE